MKHLFTLILTFLISTGAIAQTGAGICINPTGSDAGLGFKSSKKTRLFVEASVGKANLYSKPATSSFVSELTLNYRIVKLEKVFFHMGLGIRNEWNFGKNHKVGVAMPVGVEAFPFPFQNAGVIFSIAPFYTSDLEGDIYAGMRSTGGFVFYFPKKENVILR
jgi:hypothetical protein